MKEATKSKEPTAFEKFLGVLILAGLLIYMCSSPDTNQDERPSATQVEKKIACRKNLKCWGNKHITDAKLQCKPLIESLAKYNVEWTSGLFGLQFHQIGWNNKEAGTLTYGGNTVRFQNALGAWQNMNYNCVYNPNTKSVEDFEVF